MTASTSSLFNPIFNTLSNALPKQSRSISPLLSISIAINIFSDNSFNFFFVSSGDVENDDEVGGEFAIITTFSVANFLNSSNVT